MVIIKHSKQIKKPILHNNAFYKVYSPQKIKLKPTETKEIDLKFSIEIKPEDNIIISEINLFPSVQMGNISLESHDFNIKQINQSIKIQILNKNFSDIIHIQIGNLLMYLLLENEAKNLKNEYRYYPDFDQS